MVNRKMIRWRWRNKRQTGLAQQLAETPELQGVDVPMPRDEQLLARYRDASRLVC